MLSFDTNLIVYAANADAPECMACRRFFDELNSRDDVIVCELVLAEVYLKLRNPRIFKRPYTASDAADFCEQFRQNPNWLLVESAPVMPTVWQFARRPDFAFRRIIDARLALTLRHHGTDEFATANVKDFQDFGFASVWNPIDA